MTKSIALGATLLLLIPIALGVLGEDNEGPVNLASGSSEMGIQYIATPDSTDNFNLHMFLEDQVQVKNPAGEKLDIRVELIGKFA